MSDPVKMMRPILEVGMVVKNEAASIASTLSSCLPITNRFIIVDTGSTDDTVGIIRRWSETHPEVVCHLVERPEISWAEKRDFSLMRNSVLDYEASFEDDHAVFGLMMSGDETFRESTVGSLKDELEKVRDVEGADAFSLKIVVGDVGSVEGQAECVYPRILRIGSPWRYFGRVHEIPLNMQDRKFCETLIRGPWVDHRVTDHKKRNESIRGHLPVLLEMLAEDPYNARTIGLLAQTHETCAGLSDKEKPGSDYVTHTAAAIGYHMRAAEIGGPVELVARARLKALDLAASLGLYTPSEFVAHCDELCKTAPDHAETHLLRAVYMAQFKSVTQVIEAALKVVQLAEKARSQDTLFPPSPSTLWQAHFLLATCYAQMAKRGSKEKWMKKIDECAQSAVAAGGTREKFAALMESSTAGSAP